MDERTGSINQLRAELAKAEALIEQGDWVELEAKFLFLTLLANHLQRIDLFTPQLPA